MEDKIVRVKRRVWHHVCSAGWLPHPKRLGMLQSSQAGTQAAVTKSHERSVFWNGITGNMRKAVKGPVRSSICIRLLPLLGLWDFEI